MILARLNILPQNYAPPSMIIDIPKDLEEVFDTSNASVGLMQSDSPPWLQSVIAKFKQLALLAHNWDSYGAEPIPLDPFKNAVSIVNLLDPHAEPPEIVPLTDGGMQLEWHRNNIDLELELVVGSVEVYFYDLVSLEGKEYEIEICDLSNLQELIDRVSLK